MARVVRRALVAEGAAEVVLAVAWVGPVETRVRALEDDRAAARAILAVASLVGIGGSELSSSGSSPREQ